jgi:hypothetical protein
MKKSPSRGATVRPDAEAEKYLSRDRDRYHYLEYVIYRWCFQFRYACWLGTAASCALAGPAGSAVAAAGWARRPVPRHQGGQSVFWGCSAAVLRVGGVAALVLRVLA